MLSSASMVSDSVPVRVTVRLPLPARWTSLKPCTSLFSVVTLPDPRITLPRPPARRPRSSGANAMASLKTSDCIIWCLLPGLGLGRVAKPVALPPAQEQDTDSYAHYHIYADIDQPARPAGEVKLVDIRQGGDGDGHDEGQP